MKTLFGQAVTFWAGNYFLGRQFRPIISSAVKLEGSKNGRQYRTFSRGGQQHLSSSTSPAAPLQQHLSRLTKVIWWVALGELSLLLAAASLKFLWLYTNPLWEDYSQLPSILVIAGVVFETAIILEFILGKCLRQTLLASSFLHFAFLVIAIVLWFGGALNCRCFGVYQMDLRLMVALNLLLVMVLGAASYFSVPASGISNVKVLELRAGVKAGLLAGFLLTLYVTATANGRQFLGWKSGADVLVAVSDLGTVELGSEARAHVRILNNSDHSITVIGGSASCQCVVMGEFPFTIARKASADRWLNVKVASVGADGIFRKSFVFYLADADSAFVKGQVAAMVLKPDSE